MGLILIYLLGWFSHLVLCYFVIRRIPNFLLRTLITSCLSVILIALTCHDLPEFRATSMFTVGICWTVTIPLVQLTISPWDQRLTFRLFLSKILWTFLPIIRCNEQTHLGSIIRTDMPIVVMKFLLNHWVYRWFLQCEPSDSAERMCLFYLFIVTISYTTDLEMLFIRVITRNRYTIESFTNHPYLSLSLRIFWGQRYNRIVNSILKDSIFRPICANSISPALAALATFTVSGLLHVHIVTVLFGDISYVVPTFLFFILHGIACCLEKHFQPQCMEHVAWFMTHFFLLWTSPLILRPFLIEKSFFNLNPPPLFDVSWIPQLPIPKFCSK